MLSFSFDPVTHSTKFFDNQSGHYDPIFYSEENGLLWRSCGVYDVSQLTPCHKDLNLHFYFISDLPSRVLSPPPIINICLNKKQTNKQKGRYFGSFHRESQDSVALALFFPYGGWRGPAHMNQGSMKTWSRTEHTHSVYAVLQVSHWLLATISPQEPGGKRHGLYTGVLPFESAAVTLFHW